MARCNCSNARCSCVIKAGENISIEGNGRSEDPLVISASVSGGGSAQWDPGDLKWSARATVPAGWLLADGSSVSRTTYPALFAALGTIYGPGDGVSTFNLPDYTGRFMMGSDNTHLRGSFGGAAAVQLTMDEIPRHSHAIDHNHPVETTGSDGGHTHVLDYSEDPGSVFANVPQGTSNKTGENAQAVHNAGSHSHSLNLPELTGESGNAGALDPDPVPTLPPYATALPLIKT